MASNFTVRSYRLYANRRFRSQNFRMQYQVCSILFCTDASPPYGWRMSFAHRGSHRHRYTQRTVSQGARMPPRSHEEWCRAIRVQHVRTRSGKDRSTIPGGWRYYRAQSIRLRDLLRACCLSRVTCPMLSWSVSLYAYYPHLRCLSSLKYSEGLEKRNLIWPHDF